MEMIISTHSSVPIYEQIINQMKVKIHSGELPDESLLPSVRNLARQLHISMITVQKAYEELQKLGCIKSIVGKGTFVSAGKNFENEEANKLIEERLQEAVDAAKKNGVSIEHLLELVNLLYYGE